MHAIWIECVKAIREGATAICLLLPSIYSPHTTMLVAFRYNWLMGVYMVRVNVTHFVSDIFSLDCVYSLVDDFVKERHSLRWVSRLWWWLELRCWLLWWNGKLSMILRRYACSSEATVKVHVWHESFEFNNKGYIERWAHWLWYAFQW